MCNCPHINVQQYTEICLDCGRNIYEPEPVKVPVPTKIEPVVPRCEHRNVQQYTEMCLDCGRNIYDPEPDPQSTADATKHRPRCLHANVQEGTCLDCGRNIYA